MRNRAVFLDRDGTIARDVHYCRTPEDFELLPTVPEAIKVLNASGFKVVVITNQSGIARGYFTEETLAQIHKKMVDELKKHGASVDSIYYCPHQPDEGCECRKPRTALFRQATKELDIDLTRSYVIGDMQMDIDAGKTLGCQTVLVTTGLNNANEVANSPDYSADTLLQAAQWITSQPKESQRPATIIVPAYNEEQGLPIVLDRVFKVVNDDYEVIVVDDGSTDETPKVACQFPCRLIRHDVNKGKGKALQTGITVARAENVIWIDADGSYPAEVIPKMAEALKTYDMVICSRKYGKQNIPHFNRVGNFIFRNMIKGIYGFKAYDPCTGLYGAKKRYLEMMKLSSQRFAIEPEISIKGSRMNLKILDIPIEYYQRIGDAKLSGIKVGLEDLWTILRLAFWHKSRGND